MEIQARKYEGWKAVVRTDCREPNDTLCFPNLESCPYTFPEASPTGWSALNSTLIFITTDSGERLRVEGVEGPLVGIWWKGRISNEGDWIGMDTKRRELPFLIPEAANAIVQINALLDTAVIDTDRGRIERRALDGWANPYRWPALPASLWLKKNWLPVTIGVIGVGAVATKALKWW